MAIFANEGQHEDTSDTDTSDENEGRHSPSRHANIRMEPGSRNAPIIIAGDENDHEAREVFHTGAMMLASNRSLDVVEIRRRFELVCARYDLEQCGVPMEIINRMLPLPEE
ncbi:hypothetical protein PC117_g4493 [Phytophthora cactorum]|uniref:Uncharacterized protein n=1 Tax=Phytophthora cactorum TaxID=29920 RepID=A0A8T1EFG8_9STRA|nr:hypothetical protein PC117_g4493 [Phytophthora cactorum]